MDLNQFFGPLLAGGNPLYVALGAVALILWQRFGPARKPGPTPAPQPGPQPQPGPNDRPLLDILSKLLGGLLAPRAAVSVASLAEVTIPDLARARDAITAELAARAAQLQNQLAALNSPEPARPVNPAASSPPQLIP